ncbi:MAG: hypothetical protein NTX28_07535 [Novosphingobium sp.]|nr:hypothetical protein [Novosphingobium sp.]
MIEIDDEARSAITNARALLDAMLAGGWEQVCITGEEGDYFLARVPGTPNPLLAPAAVALPAVEPASGQQTSVGSQTHTVKAPHVGTVVWIAAVGAVIGKGETAARIAVLDETMEIAASNAGVVSSHAAKIGDLVEYAHDLVTLVA